MRASPPPAPRMKFSSLSSGWYSNSAGMLVMKVTIHSTPVMRASLRVRASHGGASAPPSERVGEDMGIPAPLCNERADPARDRQTREAAPEAGPQGPPRPIVEARRRRTYRGPEKWRTFFEKSNVAPFRHVGQRGAGLVEANMRPLNMACRSSTAVCGVPVMQDAAGLASVWRAAHGRSLGGAGRNGRHACRGDSGGPAWGAPARWEVDESRVDPGLNDKPRDHGVGVPHVAAAQFLAAAPARGRLGRGRARVARRPGPRSGAEDCRPPRRCRGYARHASGGS